MGENSDHFSSYIGVLVRQWVSIAYESWPLVPGTLKENIWKDIMVILKQLIIIYDLIHFETIIARILFCVI